MHCHSEPYGRIAPLHPLCLCERMDSLRAGLFFWILIEIAIPFKQMKSLADPICERFTWAIPMEFKLQFWRVPISIMLPCHSCCGKMSSSLSLFSWDFVVFLNSFWWLRRALTPHCSKAPKLHQNILQLGHMTPLVFLPVSVSTTEKGARKAHQIIQFKIFA